MMGAGAVGVAGVAGVLGAAGTTLAAATAEAASAAGPVGAAVPAGGIAWVAVTNLLIWTGLFLYLLRLHRKVRELEKES